MKTQKEAENGAANPIAIIGMACMFPRARDVSAFWRLIRRGEDAIIDTPATHWSIGDYFDPDPKRPDMTYCHRGGFLSPVSFDPTEFGIPPTLLEATDTSQLLGLAVAKAALDDARYGDSREFNRERTSVILGVTGLQELALPLGARLGHPIWRKALAEAGVAADVAEEVVQRIGERYVGWQENSFPGLLGNVVAGRIANRLNLRGTNCVVDAACASSLSAVHLAMMELAAGRSDMAIAGGVDTLNDIFMYMCFSKTPALSPTGDARPFSDDADGTVLGEGIGMLVLKRLEDAARDGDRIYAVIRSIGTSSDGRSQSIYAPHAGGQARALRNAYELAGIEPDSIGLIEAHGTGTKVGDAVEFDALRTVFREAQSDGAWCALGSVKSQIGHTKAAAGAAGLIKAALALYHGALPPTIKIKTPNAKMNVEESPFHLNTRLRPWPIRDRRPRRAGVSSFGFGGSNFHAVLEEHSGAVREPAWDGSVQILAMSAQSMVDLRGQLGEWQEAVAADGFGSAMLAFMAHESRVRFEPSHAHRLVLVLTDEAELPHLLDRAASGLSQAAMRTEWSQPGIYYGHGAPQGRLAFLFPGQGSQYVNMGVELACHFPEFQEVLCEADALRDATESELAESVYPPAAFTTPAEERHKEKLNRTDVTQPALGAVSLGMLRVLSKFGVTPQMAAGHSYGELPALCAAGAFDARALHQLSRLRGRLMAGDSGEKGAMLAVAAPLSDIETMLMEERLDLVLANRNSPTQGVLSGDRGEIRRAAEACKRRRMSATPLKVSGAFHTSFMESAVEPLRRALAAMEFEEPAIPVYSNITAGPYPADPAEARELLSGQLLAPVDFVGEIRQMYDSGARTFVEVGPKSVLCGLVEATLEGQDYRCLAVDASQGKLGGIADLARLLATLAAEGRTIDLSKWERPAGKPRVARMSVTLTGANYRTQDRNEPRYAGCAVAETAPPASIAQCNDADSGKRIPESVGFDSREQQHQELDVSETEAITESSPSAMNQPNIHMTENPSTAYPLPPRAPVPSAGAITEALRVVQDGIAAMQALQQQTAAAHQKFLEGQEQAHRLYQQLIEQQHRLLTTSNGVRPAAPQSVSPTPTSAPPASPIAPVAVSMPVNTPPIVPAIPAAPPRHDMPTTALKPQTAAPRNLPSTVKTDAPVVAASSPGSFDEIVLGVVCEKTGYPRDMIDLSMDIEADLGIDSIKRVEIVAAVEERIPSFQGVKPEDLGGLRTLQEIVNLINGGDAPHRTTASTALTSPVSKTALPREADDNAAVLVDVVSQLTGYPREMIDMSMDLEADLGIDSIKRVEILAAVESRIPNMPATDAETMGAMRTLQQIASYIGGATGAKPKDSPRAAESDRPETPTPFMETARIERSVLKIVEIGPASARRPAIAEGHEVLITNDGSPLAALLADRFISMGIAARVIGLSTEWAVHRPVGGLIVLAPMRTDPGSDEVAFLRSVFVAAKRCAKSLQDAGSLGGAIFATVARMDGAFGLMQSGGNAIVGGLSGIAKTAAREWPGVRCRALDVAEQWRDHAAVCEAIVRDLGEAGPVEVGLDEASRRGLVLERAEICPSDSSGRKGEVFVVSGGARGVTAEAAVALARRHQPTIILLGRSAPPEAEPGWLVGLTIEEEIKRAILAHEFDAANRPKPAIVQASYERHLAHREVRRTIERIAQTGAQVAYRSVDICDESSVRRVMQEVQASFGPVIGLVHGAGVLEDALIVDKSPEQFTRVVATKIVGLKNVLSAIDRNALRDLVLFSSVSARFGNRGQADYAAANEALNKWAWQLARELPRCRVKSLNWGPWDGGMVGPSLKREFLRQGVWLIPLAAGAEVFVDELTDPSVSVEVVLGSQLPDVDRDLPGAGAKRSDEQQISKPECTIVAFERRLSMETDAFLGSHILGGRPVAPLAMLMEWMAHAAACAHPGMSFAGLDDVRVFRAAALEGDALSLKFVTDFGRRDGHELHVSVEIRSGDGADGGILHASGTVVLSDRPLAGVSERFVRDLDGRPCRFSVAQCYREILFHGPHFQGIDEIGPVSQQGLQARVSCGPSPRHWMANPMRSDWLTDPLALDCVFQLAIVWCAEELGKPSLPSRVGRYRQFAAHYPREGVSVAMIVRENTPRRMTADVILTDADGRIVARMDGYECTADSALAASFGKQAEAATAT